MPGISGGLPCKHLVWEEEDRPVEKTAEQSILPIVGVSDLVGGPRDT